MQGFNFFLMQTAITYLSTKVEQSKCINRPVDVIFLPFFIGTNFTGWYTETTSVLSVLLKNLINRKYLLKGACPYTECRNFNYSLHMRHVPLKESWSTR